MNWELACPAHWPQGGVEVWSGASSCPLHSCFAFWHREPLFQANLPLGIRRRWETRDKSLGLQCPAPLAVLPVLAVVFLLMLIWGHLSVPFDQFPVLRSLIQHLSCAECSWIP